MSKSLLPDVERIAPMHDEFSPIVANSIDATRLNWLCSEYLSAIRSKIGKRTGLNYCNRIKHFLDWSASRDHLTEADFANFASYLAGTSLKKTTQVDVLVRVGQMFRWAHGSGYAKADYSLWLPTINAPQTVFVPLTRDNIWSLLDTCRTMRYAQRDQAIIALMAGAGLRLNECCSLDTDDLSFDADATGSVIVRSGKNSKSRVVGFPSEHGIFIRKWIEILDTPGAVLVSQKGARMKADSMYGEFKIIAQKAGLACSPHDLRRFFATQWIIKHPDRLLELQKQMGHSDPAQTSAYIWLTPEYMRALQRK